MFSLCHLCTIKVLRQLFWVIIYIRAFAISMFTLYCYINLAQCFDKTASLIILALKFLNWNGLCDQLTCQFMLGWLIQQAEITMWWKSMLKCAITIHQQHVLVNLLISRLYAIWDLALNSPFWFFSREKYIMVIWCSLNLPEDILSNQSLWERYESGVGLLLFSFPSSSINILN